MAGGFGLLILLLGYWQVIAANGLDDRPGNPRIVQREREIDRGRIISADGVVLAYSRAVRVQGKKVFERVYPHGDLAPHVVGYTSVTQGRTGLESTWNRYLAGSYGTQPLLQRLNLSEKQGADIHVTLNTKVQRVADDALSGQTGAVVALNARTGAVLAMASTPSYNLAARVHQLRRDPQAGAGAPLLNRATAGRYPPGSTFKAVTADEALESGLYTPESTFDDTGQLRGPRADHPQLRGRDLRQQHAERRADLLDQHHLRQDRHRPRRRSASGGPWTAWASATRPPIDLPQGEVLPSGRVGPQRRPAAQRPAGRGHGAHRHRPGAPRRDPAPDGDGGPGGGQRRRPARPVPADQGGRPRRVDRARAEPAGPGPGDEPARRRPA